MKGWHLQHNNNRKPAFAGKFYPENKNELIRELRNLFREARQADTKQQLRALISPHAGYIFSGRVAASAFNQIPEKAEYQRVFVLASSHQFHFRGASVFNTGNYSTPLGEIRVDTDLANQLIHSSDLFREKSETHEFEHSLEVQLPFLQYKLGKQFLLVPVILSTNNPEECKKLAEVLKPWFLPENLFVVSTDFSHYPEYNEANKVDYLTAQALCSNEPHELLQVLEQNKKINIKNLATSLCGWTSVLTLLYLTENEKIGYEKIEYLNSGDAEGYGEKHQVVGYWAIAAYANWEGFYVSEDEKQELLEKARISIVRFVKTGKKGKIIPSLSKGIVNETSGVFVSIYVNNELHGCIGGFAQKKSLNEMVQSMAVSAASDCRFEDLRHEDLENMELEISVLSPLKKIESIEEIVLGKHGIYIKKGLKTGTFLPQVATKTGWDLDKFLGHCSRDKAGLGWEGWKNAEIYTFEAFVFRGQQPLV